MRHITLNLSAAVLSSVAAFAFVNSARAAEEAVSASVPNANEATSGRLDGSRTNPDRDQLGRADMDGNGQITVYDLALMLGHWGNCPQRSADPCAGDINADGVVDEADLGLMLSFIGIQDIPVIEFPSKGE
jgi:hypothetical protein